MNQRSKIFDDMLSGTLIGGSVVDCFHSLLEEVVLSEEDLEVALEGVDSEETLILALEEAEDSREELVEVVPLLEERAAKRLSL